MQKLFFFTLLLFALAGCKEFHDDTTVNGRIIDAVTGEPVPNEKVWLVESTSAISPEGGKFDYMESVITDQDGKFTFTFEARQWDKFQYFGIMDSYLNSEIYVTGIDGLKYTTGDLSKYQTNTIELKVAQKAQLKTIAINDTFPSGTDTLKLRTIHPILNWSPGPGNTLTGAIGTLEGGFIECPAGPILYELDIYKNGMWHHRQDSVYVQPGSKTTYTIRY